MKARTPQLARLSLALALATGSAGAWAQSSVTIYGVMDVGVEFAKAGSVTKTSEQSSVLVGSRLGFRGVEDLGGGLSALFKLESGINLDTGSFTGGGLAFGREATVGLSSSSFGTLLFGRAPTPYYLNNLTVDASNSGGAGSLLAVQRSTPTANNYTTPLLSNARVDNAISYISPLLANAVTVRLLGGFGEKGPALGDTYNASVRYTQGPWDLTASYMRQNGANNASANGSIRAVEAGGNYNFGVAKLYAGYTKETNDCQTCTGILAKIGGLTPTGAGDFRLINLGVRASWGLVTAFAQATKIQDRSAYALPTGNRDALQLATGIEYAMSKRTILWASVGTVNNKNDSMYGVNAGNGPRGANFVPAGNPRASSLSLGTTLFF